MKDDAIAQLSDQLMTLAIRLQEIEESASVRVSVQLLNRYVQ